MAQGSPTLIYSWLFNGGAPTNSNVDPTTTNTPNLVVNNIQAANGTVGKYNCLVVNDYGSTNSFTNTLSVLIPQTVNIDALHGFVDPTFFLPTNTTIYYTVTNAVVYTREITNNSGVFGGPFTGPANGEFYIQDSSGGICVFVAGTHTQPRQGDIVTVTGPLSQFSSLLELNLSTSDTSTSLTVTGHTNNLPTPVVLPFSFTNGVGFVSVSNVIRHYEGLLVTLTNVYFPGYSLGTNFASGTYIITNASGGGFSFFLNSANTNIIGLPVSQFAQNGHRPDGVSSLVQRTQIAVRALSLIRRPIRTSSRDRLRRWACPAAPAAAKLESSIGPPEPWVPYSIWWQTNISLPFTNQWTLIATNLIFNNTSGTFSDTVNTNQPAGFYRISSP